MLKEFSFWGVTDDLYKAREFLSLSKGFEHVWLGNKGFSLESPNQEATAGNYEALTIMLKKSQSVTLNRLERTHPVLKYLTESAELFQHIESLVVECNSRYLGDLRNISRLKGLKSLTFHQPYFDEESQTLTEHLRAILKQLTGLESLGYFPIKDVDIVALVRDSLASL